MKKVLVFSLLFVLVNNISFAQNKVAAEIRRLENLELASVQKADTATLLKLWAKDFVVNNPYGEVVTLNQILGFIREGQIDYSSVERVIEKITLTENLAIAMGKEIVTPQKATENAGKTVTRRYTNIWIKTKTGWHLTARQATNILVQ